jgi:hypothetical protein
MQLRVPSALPNILRPPGLYVLHALSPKERLRS